MNPQKIKCSIAWLIVNWKENIKELLKSVRLSLFKVWRSSWNLKLQHFISHYIVYTPDLIVYTWSVSALLPTPPLPTMITWEPSACFWLVLRVYIIRHGDARQSPSGTRIKLWGKRISSKHLWQKSVFHAKYCLYLVQGRTRPSFFSHILNFLNLFCKSSNLILWL